MHELTPSHQTRLNIPESFLIDDNGNFVFTAEEIVIALTHEERSYAHRRAKKSAA